MYNMVLDPRYGGSIVPSATSAGSSKTVPTSTYSGPIGMEINNTQQGANLVNANQEQAKKMGITIPGSTYKPPEAPQSIKDNATKFDPKTGAYNSNATASTSTDDQDEMQRAQDARVAEWDQVGTTAMNAITNIQNGTTPLTAGEQAQIDGLKLQFQQMIDEQVKVNANAQATGQMRGAQGGALEYDPLFQAKTIGSIISAGQVKIADLQTKEASAVASLTQSFKDNDIKAVQEAWKTYQDTKEKSINYFQKVMEDTQKAIKDAGDAKIAADKAYYEQVEKPISDLSKQAAKNGAPPAVVTAIAQGQSVDEAIALSQGFIQEATGDLGEYLNYKRQAEANGQVAATYDTWMDTKQKREKQDKLDIAYASAYASTKGRLAAEKEAGVASKPLTEGQAKDFTYAQRGDQANAIVNNLANDIAQMDTATYTLNKLAEENTISSMYVSEKFKNMRQAERNFLTAILRRESGAQIAPSEFEVGEKLYFPLPQDPVSTLIQKAQARETAIASFKANVPNYQERVNQTVSGSLMDAENTATQTLQGFISMHPEQQSAVTQQIGVMEQTLGRPISSMEFLQAFPEYKQ